MAADHEEGAVAEIDAHRGEELVVEPEDRAQRPVGGGQAGARDVRGQHAHGGSARAWWRAQQLLTEASRSPGSATWNSVPSLREPAARRQRGAGGRRTRHAERDELVGVGQAKHEANRHDAGQRAGDIGATVGRDDDVQAERPALRRQAGQSAYAARRSRTRS